MEVRLATTLYRLGEEHRGPRFDEPLENLPAYFVEAGTELAENLGADRAE